MKRCCLMNYTIGCLDVSSGQTGCFLFETTHWQETGQFRAISPVFTDLAAFYAWNNTNGRPGHGEYIEREVPDGPKGVEPVADPSAHEEYSLCAPAP